jgi:hypothetical protein
MFLSFTSILKNSLKQTNKSPVEIIYNKNVAKLSEYAFDMELANIKSCEIYEKYNKKKVPRFLLLNENENKNKNTNDISKYKPIFLVISGFIFLAYFHI